MREAGSAGRGDRGSAVTLAIIGGYGALLLYLGLVLAFLALPALVPVDDDSEPPERIRGTEPSSPSLTLPARFRRWVGTGKVRT